MRPTDVYPTERTSAKTATSSGTESGTRASLVCGSRYIFSEKPPKRCGGSFEEIPQPYVSPFSHEGHPGCILQPTHSPHLRSTTGTTRSPRFSGTPVRLIL